jgi:hypothetical protein
MTSKGTVSTVDALIKFTIKIPEVEGQELMVLAQSLLEICTSSPSLFSVCSVTIAETLENLHACGLNVKIMLPGYVEKSER